MLLRHLAIVLPICIALGALPATLGTRIMVAALAFVGSVFTLAISTDQIHEMRLRQHGLDDRTPGDRYRR